MTLNSKIKSQLLDLLGSNVSFDEPMERHTYFRVGGPADVFAAPMGREELLRLARCSVENGIPYWVLGGGTNLLVRDSGLRGIVIDLTRGFARIIRSATPDGKTRITAMAGAKLAVLCRFAWKNGFAGMNFAVGIPGTVGGGLIMNAGTAAGAMEDVVESISVMDTKGVVRKIPRKKLSFGYRKCTWPDRRSSVPESRPIILEGSFHLGTENPVKLKNEADALLRQRKKTQPLNQFSAGCFFKNPPAGKTAGELIDLAGLKGKKIGNAQVSKKHANFIINRGGATAEDILKLSGFVRDSVFKKFNIELEPEVKIVGSEK